MAVKSLRTLYPCVLSNSNIMNNTPTNVRRGVSIWNTVVVFIQQLQNLNRYKSLADSVVYSWLELNVNPPNEQAARRLSRVFNEHNVVAAFPRNITFTVSGTHTFTPCLTQPLCEKDVLIPAWNFIVRTFFQVRKLFKHFTNETKPLVFIPWHYNSLFFVFCAFSISTYSWDQCQRVLMEPSSALIWRKLGTAHTIQFKKLYLSPEAQLKGT